MSHSSCHIRVLITPNHNDSLLPTSALCGKNQCELVELNAFKFGWQSYNSTASIHTLNTNQKKTISVTHTAHT